MNFNALNNHLSKGQKITILTLFIPTILTILSLMNALEKAETFIFWFYLAIFLWIFMFLSFFMGHFLQKHKKLMTHAFVFLFLLLNIINFGNLSIQSRSHWEPVKPSSDFGVANSAFFYEYEFIKFCKTDLKSMFDYAYQNEPYLVLHKNGVVNLTKFNPLTSSLGGTYRWDTSCLATPEIYTKIFHSYLKDDKKLRPLKIDGFEFFGISNTGTEDFVVFIKSNSPNLKKGNKQTKDLFDELDIDTSDLAKSRYNEYTKHLNSLRDAYTWIQTRKKIKDFPQISLKRPPFDKDYGLLWLLSFVSIGFCYFRVFSTKDFYDGE